MLIVFAMTFDPVLFKWDLNRFNMKLKDSLLVLSSTARVPSTKADLAWLDLPSVGEFMLSISFRIVVSPFAIFMVFSQNAPSMQNGQSKDAIWLQWIKLIL